MRDIRSDKNDESSADGGDDSEGGRSTTYGPLVGRLGEREEGRNAVYRDRGILQRHAQRIRVHSLVVIDVEG